MARFPTPKILRSLHVHALTKYVLELFVIGGIYLALAKLDLALAAIHPSAIPIAPAPGFALGAILLRGLRVWPAIFVAAMAAHAPSAIADATLMDWTLALLIATGEALEAVIAGYLINIWSDGRRALESRGGDGQIRNDQRWTKRDAWRHRCCRCLMPHWICGVVRLYRSLD